jgi:hypothetical protein
VYVVIGIVPWELSVDRHGRITRRERSVCKVAFLISISKSESRVIIAAELALLNTRFVVQSLSKSLCANTVFPPKLNTLQTRTTTFYKTIK